jgi:hypothetical protein
MKKILQINFKFKIKRSEIEQTFLKMAPMFGPTGTVKGLLWKIWLMNEAEKSAGGIYLFKDDASLQAYLKGEIVTGMKSNPALSDVELRVSDIIPECTKITLGPVD